MRSAITGTMLVFLYCLVTAVSTIIVNQVEIVYHPLLVTSVAIGITILYFNIIQFKNFSNIKLMYKKHLKLLLMINISTAIMWITTFFGLQITQPDVFTAILFGSMPIFILIFTAHTITIPGLKKVEYLFSFIIACLLFGIAYNSLLIAHFDAKSILSLVVTFVCSISAAWTIILMHKFGKLDYSATEVLSQRFYVLFISASLIMLWVLPGGTLSHHFLMLAACVAVTSIILPLFLLQKGIERVDPVMVSFLCPFIPILAFCIEMLYPNYVFDWVELVLLILLAVVILTASVVKLRIQKSK